MSTEYRADIDGLRAVAVALVVGFHAFPDAVPGGYVGVDVFFVISGYLISGLILSELRSSSFSIPRFYARRGRRILPALAFVLLIVLAFGWWRLPPVRYQSLGLHTIAGALFFPNLLLWKESGYFDVASETKPLLHLWSLGVEEQFYLVWPLLLSTLRGRWLVPSLILIVTGSFAFSVYATQNPNSGDAFYLPWSRLWELGVGGILAAINWRKKDYDILSLAGVLLIIGSAMMLNNLSPFPGARALLPVGGAALVIVSSSRLLASKWPVFIGLISYPLYLWHWPLLSFAAVSGLTTWPIRAALVTLSIVLAWLTTALVERPLRFGRFRSWNVPVSLVAMTVIVGFSSIVWSRSGILRSYPDEIQPVLATMRFDPTGENIFHCWAPAIVGFDKYPADCGLGDTLVWGDSHAGRLYEGLKRDGVKVAEYIKEACPPSLEVGYELCMESNAALLRKVAELKPKKIILFAVWRRYIIHGLNDSPDGGLTTTLRELRKLGCDVIVIGEAPYWQPDLPMQVYNSWRSRGYLPDRLPLNPQLSRNTDRLLARASAAAGVKFISAFDALCNEQGCLTHTPASRSQLLSFDYGHLTVPGARFVVNLLQLD